MPAAWTILKQAGLSVCRQLCGCGYIILFVCPLLFTHLQSGDASNIDPQRWLLEITEKIQSSKFIALVADPLPGRV